MKKLIVIILLFSFNSSYSASNIDINFITPTSYQFTVTANINGRIDTLTYDEFDTGYYQDTMLLAGLQQGVLL